MSTYKKNTTKKAPAPTTSSAEDVKVGDRIIVTIKRIGINGEGVGYYRRKAVFITGVLPEEVVKAKVTRIEPKFIHAELLELEKQSPDRQKPECSKYEVCGGCQLQHMTYPAQLRAKEELVKEAFDRYTGLKQLPLKPILGMKQPWSYRNKAQMQAGFHDSQVLMGLYSPGTHKLVDISGCPIQHPDINKVIDTTKAILSELRIPIYNEKQRKGVVRTVVARVSQISRKVQLTLITADNTLPQKSDIIARIRKELPSVISISQNVNKGNTPLIFGERTLLLWGQERLEESLGNVKFSLSPRAFFQLNPEQTVKLYDSVKQAAALTGKELVVDAYCGTGTIALWLAPHAKEVRGIEIIPEAVEDARNNARLSGADNARFYVGEAERLLPDWVRQGTRPDVIVVDPPRTGCDNRLLTALLAAKPARLVYVSCNPSTLAKDCKVLLDGGFKLESVQPVDMFPHTSHVECVALLKKGV